MVCHIGQNQIVIDRGNLIHLRFTKFTLNVIFSHKPVAAMRVEAGQAYAREFGFDFVLKTEISN